jgi:hypothetical protein
VHKRKGKRAGVIAHRSKERQASSKVKKMRRWWSLATAAGRAALRCVQGRGSYGPGDENLQQLELDEPLVNPRRKKEGRRRLSFTGGGGNPRRRCWGIDARARGVVCCGCKGECRSSSACLNSSRERKERRWKGDHRPASLPLMACGRSGTIGNREGKHQGNGGEN